MPEMSIFWDQLLELIDDGRVVPVVGPDLIIIPTDSGPVPLYSYLAQRMAEYLQVSGDNLPPRGGLNEVACRYLAPHKEHPVSHVYTAVKKVASRLDELPPPDALLKLAAIKPFRLFVTTTFDSFLARALDQKRGAGTRVIAYSPEHRRDLEPDSLTAAGATVYHLLGKLSATPNFAVTQWDLVEFFHGLQSETRRPPLLLDELSRRSLLIIGSSLGGWLARFFMRLAKGDRTQGPVATDFVADAHMTSDSGLVLFLRRFNRGVEIFEGSPVEFVNELHRRWLEIHPDGASPPVTLRRPRASTLGAVFLSYASEDRVAVEKIRNAMESKGIDVFFDKDSLEGGDLWEPKLRRMIRECSVFMPVLSRNTAAPGKRWFKLEWNLALEEAQKFSDEEVFLMPVVIDETSGELSGVPPRFRNVQWERLPDGDTTPDFVARVQKLYRLHQKGLDGGAA